MARDSLEYQPEKLERITTLGTVIAFAMLGIVVFGVNGYHIIKEAPWSKPKIERRF